MCEKRRVRWLRSTVVLGLAPGLAVWWGAWIVVGSLSLACRQTDTSVEASGSGGRGGEPGAGSNGSGGGAAGGNGGSGGSAVGSGDAAGTGGGHGGVGGVAEAGGGAAGGNAGAGDPGGATGGAGGGSPDSGNPEVPSGACPGSPSTSSAVDGKTCLVWQKPAGALPMLTNKQAAKHCADLVADGFDDWRVPAPEEIVTWPALAANSNAFITNPTYIPIAASEADGCTGNSHSCNIAEYNAGTATCAWQGVGFQGPTVCVRGNARAGTTAAAFAASACDACKVHVTGASPDFKRADCLPYAN